MRAVLEILKYFGYLACKRLGFVLSSRNLRCSKVGHSGGGNRDGRAGRGSGREKGGGSSGSGKKQACQPRTIPWNRAGWPWESLGSSRTEFAQLCHGRMYLLSCVTNDRNRRLGTVYIYRCVYMYYPRLGP